MNRLSQHFAALGNLPQPLAPAAFVDSSPPSKSENCYQVAVFDWRDRLDRPCPLHSLDSPGDLDVSELRFGNRYRNVVDALREADAYNAPKIDPKTGMTEVGRRWAMVVWREGSNALPYQRAITPLTYYIVAQTPPKGWRPASLVDSPPGHWSDPSIIDSDKFDELVHALERVALENDGWKPGSLWHVLLAVEHDDIHADHSAIWTGTTGVVTRHATNRLHVVTDAWLFRDEHRAAAELKGGDA